MRCPGEDARFAATQHPRGTLHERRNLQTQSRRSPSDPIGHRLDPVAMPDEGAVVLADQGRQARREQIDRNLAAEAGSLFKRLGDELLDAVGSEAKKARQERIAAGKLYQPRSPL